jgi:hypothetical protein
MTWIPVTERLPEDGVDVLIANKKNGTIGIGWYWEDKLVFIGDNNVHGAGITHWIPLPEGPK